MSRLGTPALMFVVWVCLWGELSWANVLSGLVVAALTAVATRPGAWTHRVHPVALVRLIIVFLGRLITSSAAVALTVISPTPRRLRSGIVSVRMRSGSRLVATIVADAISLTPGTLTLEAIPDGDSVVLSIHVLGLADADAVRSDIAGLESLVLSAVTPTLHSRDANPPTRSERPEP